MFGDYFLLCLLFCICSFFFFKQKTAYEMRISDWSSDVCSSDLSQGDSITLHDASMAAMWMLRCKKSSDIPGRYRIVTVAVAVGSSRSRTKMRPSVGLGTAIPEPGNPAGPQTAPPTSQVVATAARRSRYVQERWAAGPCP